MTPRSRRALTGALLSLALAALLPACAGNGDARLRPPPPGPDELVSVETTGSPSRGATDAPVVIVEFADFRCAFCRRAAPVMDRVLEEHPKDVRHVYKYFPIVSEDSSRAAIAAEAAHRQGRFWELRERLYALASQPLRLSDVLQQASAAGLDVDQFANDLRSQSVEGRVEADLEEAKALGFSGTPTFVVNGRVLRGAQPYSVFDTLIAEELAKRR